MVVLEPRKLSDSPAVMRRIDGEPPMFANLGQHHVGSGASSRGAHPPAGSSTRAGTGRAPLYAQQRPAPPFGAPAAGGAAGGAPSTSWLPGAPGVVESAVEGEAHHPPLPIHAPAAATWEFPAGERQSFRSYQHSICRTALFHNTLVSIPTGFGKTLIGAVTIRNLLRWFPRGQAVFMAPTRPLVQQQLSAVCSIAGLSEYSDALVLTGETPPWMRRELWEEKRLYFCTPQVVENDLRSGVYSARRLVCLVVDEAKQKKSFCLHMSPLFPTHTSGSRLHLPYTLTGCLSLHPPLYTDRVLLPPPPLYTHRVLVFFNFKQPGASRLGTQRRPRLRGHRTAAAREGPPLPAARVECDPWRDARRRAARRRRTSD